MLKPDGNSPQAWFRIQYEKLSLFCFLCGVMRHSELECATPAAWNAEGKLPYDCKYRCLQIRSHFGKLVQNFELKRVGGALKGD